MIAPSIPEYSEINQGTRAEIFGRSKCLHGIILRASGPTTSDTSVAQFKSSFLPLPLCPPEHTSSQLQTLSTLSKSDFALIEKGWSEDAIFMQKMGIHPALRDESFTTSEPGDTLHILGRLQVPCIAIRMSVRDLSPTQTFIESVTAALSQPDRASKLGSLQAVLSQFGHVLAAHMVLGASLLTTKKKLFTTTEAKLSEEDALKSQLLESLSSSQTWSFFMTNMFHLYTKGGKRSILPGLDTAAWLSTLRDPKTWDIIEISSVIPTITLLDDPLKRSIQELLTPPPASPPPPPPSVPVVHFPGRLSSWYGRCSQTSGYVELPLSIKLNESFTISAWMRRGGGRNDWRCLMSIESPHEAISLLWMGYAMHDNFFSARSDVDSRKQEHRIVLKAQTGGPVDEKTWMHVAFTQEWNEKGGPKEWSLFINGRKESWRTVGAPVQHRDEARLVLGRGVYRSIRDNAWDGQIENVKVYDRSLSEKEITEAARVVNKPNQRGAWQNDYRELKAF